MDRVQVKLCFIIKRLKEIECKINTLLSFLYVHFNYLWYIFQVLKKMLINSLL